MTEVVEIVEATVLPTMLYSALKAGWDDFDYHAVEVEGYATAGDGKTICQGEGYARGDKSGIDHHFDFEVNLGTHKDDLVVFEELEVVVWFR